MKKHFLFLTTGLFFFFVCVFSQSADTTALSVPETDEIKTLAKTTYDALFSACIMLISLINWLFVIVLIGTSSVMNEAIDADNVANKMSYFKKYPRGLRTFVIGTLFMILFIWAFEIKDRMAIFGIIMSILLSMVTMSVGLNKFTRWLSERFGLRFGVK